MNTSPETPEAYNEEMAAMANSMENQDTIDSPSYTEAKNTTEVTEGVEQVADEITNSISGSISEMKNAISLQSKTADSIGKITKDVMSLPKDATIASLKGLENLVTLHPIKATKEIKYLIPWKFIYQPRI